MPSWWGKSSSKDEKKKSTKEGLLDALHRKFRITNEEKSCNRSRGSQRRQTDTVANRGALSRVPSRSPSPSTRVSRSQSFTAERTHALPPPLPHANPPVIGRTDSDVSASTRPRQSRISKPSLHLPLPKPRGSPHWMDNAETEGDLANASVSSDGSAGDNPSYSRPLSPRIAEYENGNKSALSSPSSMMRKDLSPISHKNSAETLKPSIHLGSNQKHQIQSTSPKQRSRGTHIQNLQIPRRDALASLPDSSLSSPSRSPMRSFGPDPLSNSNLQAVRPHIEGGLFGSGQCSSPGSGYNSGNNSVGGDHPGQVPWSHCRCSPECSPVPSPRMTSPGPGSRIHSGTVTPTHSRAGGGSSTGSPTRRFDESRKQSHRLPLPPVSISNPSPFSPTYSAAASPSVPRSPGRTETPASPGSRWKKGRLLGNGSFGHVYLGFNRESGEFCAMKEVALFPDDPKSKESAQHLGQEIALLSRLDHPNIVRYYGSETIDDKLYIYLEYVSGGSIFKLLGEYGQFGENAIRNFTQQILKGLAYLHGKSTVHRDIKGANILVDPSGRVKLADFGMAKHITGQPSPLSFKGSPYWMAPEVIKSSNGCNLAVDIWSLGCTVLEMAAGKPPWSQYGAVPAMFKIGNSKELPEIPSHLSEDGKDFVRRCLQRNPACRPTAAQLLEHPFVKNATSLERPIPSPESSETNPTESAAMKILGVGNARKLEDMTDLRGLRTGLGSSASHTPRNMSRPISPVGSPIWNSRSPQHICGRRSPSPISSPHTASGSSTPLNGGCGAVPFHVSPRSQSSFHSVLLYQEPNLCHGRSQPSHGFWDSQPGQGQFMNGQAVLADHVSQQLLSEHLKLKQPVELKPRSTHGRSN